MKRTGLQKFTALLGTCAVMAVGHGWAATSITFDDFNVNEGHFGVHPTYSGGTVGILTTSTANRVTTGSPLEGAGYEQLTLFSTNSANPVRVRFLSGLGTPANNVEFTTSSGQDGWIGCYVRTTNTGWTVQLHIEGASVNGGNPISLINDGQWHVYEWNLDDNSGGTNAWGTISGIATGVATVADGVHTIDGVVFRCASPPAGTNTHVIDMDFVAQNTLGSITNLISEPCLKTAGLLVENGPISVTSTQVAVKGVTSGATLLKVYQNTGSGWVVAGTKSSGIVAGSNSVPVSGLVKGALVAATQVVAGQEGCEPSTGIRVGGGANPPVRVALSLKETTTAGPVGADGSPGGKGNIHFIPCASTLSGACPNLGTFLVYPSNEWQTITVRRGIETIGDVPSVTGTAKAGSYYGAGDSLYIQVYAFRTVPTSGIKIFSTNAATSASVTSDATFVVDWSWPAVAGAQGYRVVRNHSAGFSDYRDETGPGFADNDPAAWHSFPEDFTLQPNSAPTMQSVCWNGTGTSNNIPGNYAILEAIAIASQGDSGPYDIFIDDLANGTHGVFQDFESFTAGTIAGPVFRQPSYSSTTSGMILVTPNTATMSDATASSGTKSIRTQWQFKTTLTNAWLRLTTDSATVMPNPMVDLSQPISFKILVLPVGSVPTPTTPPNVQVSRNSTGQVILNWTGSYKLQTSVSVGSGYTNVPSVTTGPWTNSFTEAARFFRLSN